MFIALAFRCLLIFHCGSNAVQFYHREYLMYGLVSNAAAAGHENRASMLRDFSSIGVRRSWSLRGDAHEFESDDCLR